ncbi:leucyl aminopeptidase family protein [Flectobacillus major]|jgi:leucyl aminopeptidase|uniref:leucyl aminopeptidase family protein n=1 Tax=Flectobacillus major TaxID=103 RepID=UPI0004014054|nr:leucyl aminopeptidase family protein [Flectobacillus major]
MQIQLFSEISQTNKVAIYLLWQNENLAQQLTTIASQNQVEVELLQNDFKADWKEILSFYTPNATKIILLGLGKNSDSGQVIRAVRTLFAQQKSKFPNEVTVVANHLPTQQIEWIVNGIVLGGYDIKLYKTDEKSVPAIYGEDALVKLLVEPAQLDVVQHFVQKGQATAETQIQIFDLMNAPANKKTPQVLVDWAIESAKKYGYDTKILYQKDLQEQGLEALLAVGQGSEHDSALIIVEYRGQNAGKTVGLVGKGVTFDTGGISIKSSSNMHLMKSDMGGAAAVLGTVELAAKLQLPVHLVGIVPTCENAVDAKSFKPSDVIGSYLGKTIEIIDTDAEGRVILADGLGYMVKNYTPDVLIDLATLTGSCIATLGYHAAGLFTNNDTLALQLVQAGDTTGERLWRLPLWDVYNEDLSSDIADLRNYSGKPLAGAITAAKFLEAFTEKHPKWAHLDIAGTAYGDADFASQRAGTAYGIRLLINFLSTLS